MLAFDFHGGWEGKTGHHSPLFGKSADQGLDSILNVVRFSIHPIGIIDFKSFVY